MSIFLGPELGGDERVAPRRKPNRDRPADQIPWWMLPILAAGGLGLGLVWVVLAQWIARWI